MGKSTIHPKEVKELLWTSSVATFEPQTINLPIGDYSFIEIWVSGVNLSPMVSYRFAVSGPSTGTISITRNELIAVRNVNFTNTSITFGDGAYYNGYGNYQVTTVQNYNVVPHYIYGIK